MNPSYMRRHSCRIHTQLVDSYRLIFDSASALSYEVTPARPPPPAETIERMLQAATYGAQVLDAAAKRVVPEPPRPTAPDRNSEEDDGEGNRARQVRDASVVAPARLETDCMRHSRRRPCLITTARARTSSRPRDRRAWGAVRLPRQSGGVVLWVSVYSRLYRPS